MRSTPKITLLFLPVLFLLVIALPLFNGITEVWTFERTDENRTFHDQLEFDINNLDGFPKECDSFVQDNFAFRTPLLDIYHQMKFSWFKISSHPELFIVGKNDWYFIAGKEKEIYEGERNFSHDELAKFSTEWRRRKDFFKQRGIQTYWVIAPMKHYVYENELPFNLYRHSPDRVTQLENHLEEEFPGLIINPREKFKQVKDSVKLYYQLDNHWNYRAGHIVTEMIIDRIKADLPNKGTNPINGVTWIDTTKSSGYLYNLISIDGLSESEQWAYFPNEKSVKATPYGFPCKYDFPYCDQYERRFENTTIENGVRVLIIRDSFGSFVLPFAREAFGESVFIWDAWKYKLNEEIIDKVKPDVVLFMNLETHLESYINNPPSY